MIRTAKREKVATALTTMPDIDDVVTTGPNQPVAGLSSMGLGKLNNNDSVIDQNVIKAQTNSEELAEIMSEGAWAITGA